jgi:hypothetical protein
LAAIHSRLAKLERLVKQGRAAAWKPWAMLEERGGAVLRNGVALSESDLAELAKTYRIITVHLPDDMEDGG